MQYRVQVVPIHWQFSNINSDGRADEMVKFDPKLVKKISHSKLISCATEIGIKNADKVSKDLLIPAYLDAVEKADTDGNADKLTANVVNLYNEIVTTLELNKEEPTPTPEAEAEAPATPEPPPPPPPPVARRVGRAPAAPAPAAPAPAAAPAAAKAAAPPKAEKAKRTPPAPKTFNRWTALGDTLLKMKTGTVQDLVVAANQTYVDQGGKDNIKESATVVKCSLSVIEKMGVVTLSNGNFTVN